MPGTVKPDSGKVMAALARRYRAPEFALFEQCGNGTGFTGNRYADAIAMSLWPSRGLDLYGFEIKVYRGDWLRELRNPSKAEEVASYCDFWFVVVPGPGIVELAEVPQPWGLMETGRRGLRMMKPAERKLPAAHLGRPMVAAILRRASEGMVPRSSIANEIQAAKDEGVESGKQQAGMNRESQLQELKQLRERVTEFETASGVKVNSYGGGNIGRLFKAVSTMDQLKVGWSLRNAEKDLSSALEALSKARVSLARPEGE